ncbi:SEC-C metal-binding domain-containing protein [Cohnella sp. REN36]|uniref:SEC-C metal-binding domain-containing protein n=1 Tax=Cohnella sp. REN36 TaxID=2887347 RepID=UPI001D159E7C|nr:SEC-C metal-binding domain-containing protein [Cohnella sp. REN36]MCC3377584.1 SEC-C domain-containing protein [Cohnella sp. REN36]
MIDIPPSPDLSLLPGKLTKSIIKYKKRIDLPAASRRENLICGHCGCQGKYDLGLIAFNMERWMKEKNATSTNELNYQVALNYVQSTGYFRCKVCNGAGEWEFKDPFFIFGLLTRLLDEGKNKRTGYIEGEIRLYDGSLPKWATHAEDALLAKLMDNGNNGLLWNKLGNLYQSGGRPELAAAAFEKSLQMDPSQVESHYSLGSLLYQIGDLENSAYHSRMALVHADRYEEMTALKLREMLSACLQDLFEIHMVSNKNIPFLPTREELALLPAFKETASSKENHLIESRDLEIFPEDRESFYPLAEMYMQHRKNELPKEERTQNTALKEHRNRISSGNAKAGSISIDHLVQIRAESEERAARLTKVCERFQIPCSIEIGYPEDLDNLEEALFGKLSLSNVYALCPCGSGNKFKFCCAQKAKNLDVELFIDEFGSVT